MATLILCCISGHILGVSRLHYINVEKTFIEKTLNRNWNHFSTEATLFIQPPFLLGLFSLGSMLKLHVSLTVGIPGVGHGVSVFRPY